MYRSIIIINNKMAALAAALCVLASSCTIKYYDTHRLLNDYKTAGFLDTDHFQVIVTGIPDEKSRGLVEKRDSALRNAKSRLNDTVVAGLVGYSVDYQLKKLKLKNVDDIVNMDDVRKNLGGTMAGFMKYGRTACEYYNEDYSAVIVYRIFKDDLIDDIESIKSEFEIRDGVSK